MNLESITVIFELQDGYRLPLRLAPKGTLMEAAKAANVPGIDADCGGCMACGTCHVLVDPAWRGKLPEPEAIERDLLDYVPEPHPDARLSCQIAVSAAIDGIVLRVPPRQR